MMIHILKSIFGIFKPTYFLQAFPGVVKVLGDAYTTVRGLNPNDTPEQEMSLFKAITIIAILVLVLFAVISGAGMYFLK